MHRHAPYQKKEKLHPKKARQNFNLDLPRNQLKGTLIMRAAQFISCNSRVQFHKDGGSTKSESKGLNLDFSRGTKFDKLYRAIQCWHGIDSNTTAYIQCILCQTKIINYYIH